MSWLASFALAVFHTVYWFVVTAKSVFNFQTAPQPLTARRKQTPTHLALLLVPPHDHAEVEAIECLMLDTLEKAVTWCLAVGIRRLTVYDRQGILDRSSLDIRSRLLRHFDTPTKEDSVGSDTEYPLTPPPSDDSDSRPLSPESRNVGHNLKVTTIVLFNGPDKVHKKAHGVKTVVRRRRPSRRESTSLSLTLHIVSRQSGKPAITRVANGLLRKKTLDLSCKKKNPGELEPSSMPLEEELNEILEGSDGFPSPDLMLVHDFRSGRQLLPLELHGFPPWQIRLTEFHQQLDPSWWGHSATTVHSAGRPLQETEFCRALDDFAAAEMRLGK